MRLIGVIWLSTLFLISCSQNDGLELKEETKGDLPMLFNVESVDEGAGSSRTLLDNISHLQDACTPKDQGGNDQKIGLWADRTENGQTELNILGEHTSLVYDPTYTGGNPYNNWNYVEVDPNTGTTTRIDPKLWKDPDKGNYKFRAYYPQSITVSEASDATHFVVTYNTATMQKDLLVAYKEVDASTFDLYTPVPLSFKHGLSAIRFQMQFKAGYSESDHLTSLWLQNDESADFSYIGMMVYGLEGNTHGLPEDPNGIMWDESAATPSYHKMYHWENSTGILFKNVDGVQTEKAIAYTLPESSKTGKEFCQNDGWLLIIPQRSPGTVTVYFTTKKGGPSSIYSVKIPKITGTDKDGTVNPSGEFYAPGYRYTYTFTLTKTNADITLGIAPWNELDSSYDIPF